MSHQIMIVTPKQIHSKSTKMSIEGFARAGVRSSELHLHMDFITSDDAIEHLLHEFKVLKNKIYFDLKSRY